MTFIPQTGSFEGMKSLNKTAILNIIRLKGPISRAEIAKMTKLTPPTVGSIVGELIDSKMVIEETGESKSHGGRKPIMLTINASSYYVIGIYGAREIIHTVIATLDGKISYSNEEKLSTPPTKDEYIDLLKNGVEKVLQQKRIKQNKVLGIGVGMHGLVDPQKGISIFSPHLHIENIPIKQELESAFDIPVLVDNDVRTLALAESWYGEGKDISNFVCLSVGLGIGSGIMLNGEIYTGQYHSAGEIGHTVVDINGPRCQCGNYGCLEAYASELAIISRVKKGLRLGRSTIINDWIKETDSQLTIEMVFDAAEKGDAFVLEVLEETGRFLGIAVANLINILTPSKVILEGRIFEAGGNTLLSPLKEIIKKSSLRSYSDDVSIVTSDLGKKGMVIGAFTLVLKELYTTGKVLTNGDGYVVDG
ncbi:ROK family transcriptional regulator [Evansella cellulosilytica]|uniref:ROK family protein n=1 Tax=Evansella cellulosilytica (strain ATCC 21833 / DSM 2522 / FERM P-1141 / JCM 9156 / N-4) TaxID=649639 RepID=E6TQC7_EVAC2|nr:ROK family transcriptional regulator [Evansella cellulosilytica]ADU29305.1 ROK family protein [Evansella cellulosilytica DSM 2522]